MTKPGEGLREENSIILVPKRLADMF